MAEDDRAGEILRRALEYPYATPERSYLFRGGRTEDLSPEVAAGVVEIGVAIRQEPQPHRVALAENRKGSNRQPLLAYGANASPEALARKLAPLPGTELPVLRAELAGFDVVYSAHVSPYGAVPATLIASPGTTAPVFVLYLDEEQRRLIAAAELNYDVHRLDGVECAVVGVGSAPTLDAFFSRHGPLRLDGREVALAAVRSVGRTLPELDEPAILERVRAALAAKGDLERFILQCVAAGGIAPLPHFGPL